MCYSCRLQGYPLNASAYSRGVFSSAFGRLAGLRLMSPVAQESGLRRWFAVRGISPPDELSGPGLLGYHSC
jgi:hypothetical protein